MRKKLVLLLLALLFLSIAAPVFAVLRSEWVADVGMKSSTVSSDMGEVDRALSGFAALHPGAIVDSFQIVPHTASGSYDIFIFYREE